MITEEYLDVQLNVARGEGEGRGEERFLAASRASR